MRRAQAPFLSRWNGRLRALLGAAHAGPALAVTLLAGLLASTFDVSAARASLILAAVLAGQLSVGWSNDLIDVARDRIAGHTDKPLATDAISERAVRCACGLASAATVPLSLACGPLAAIAHLSGLVAGWLYNLGLKSTVWSWLPYAVAFAGLPVFVSLASPVAAMPPTWMPASAALLGVGAHFVNVLPDFDADALTGVRGLPHRIGARWTRQIAALVLVLASVVIVFGAPVNSGSVAGISLAMVGMLAVVALVGSGSLPFRAAIAIALVDVAMLLWGR